ncbi:MAG: hypothetical protein JO212_18385 [Acetobacteraceae bacterium]|nr:hypothetical protein [Acetobacteraceae bacterium]
MKNIGPPHCRVHGAMMVDMPVEDMVEETEEASEAAQVREACAHALLSLCQVRSAQDAVENKVVLDDRAEAADHGAQDHVFRRLLTPLRGVPEDLPGLLLKTRAMPSGACPIRG